MVVILSGDPRDEAYVWANNTTLKREIADSLGASAFVVLMKDPDYATFKGRMKFYMMRKSTVLNRDKDGEGSTIPTFLLSDKRGDDWVSSIKGIKSVSKEAINTGIATINQ